MRGLDLDVTEKVQEYLNFKSFVFNPSMASIKDDKYLFSVRSYRHSFNVPFEKDTDKQHPWKTNWTGKNDKTYVFPVTYKTNVEKGVDSFECIKGGKWPLVLNGEDARIFYLMTVDNYNIYILTYNVKYKNHKEYILKGGNLCDDYCGVVDWGMLNLNIDNLEYTYNPGELPLCLNISNPVEKNWSIWTIKYNDEPYLMTSYGLVPEHNVFSFKILGIENGKVVGGTDCVMKTPYTRKEGIDNIFNSLENYFTGGNLFVSLTTQTCLVKDNIYQSIGHIKVKINYLKQLVKLGNKSNLSKFTQKYLVKEKRIYYHPTYVYFMFFYRFRVILPGEKRKQKIIKFNSSPSIKLTGTSIRFNTELISVSPAFILDVDERNYFLNFPTGMVLNDNTTLITYGNGDTTAHIVSFLNKDVDDFLKPVENITPKNFKFKIARIDENRYVNIK
jgi:hypothetical protein